MCSCSLKNFFSQFDKADPLIYRSNLIIKIMSGEIGCKTNVSIKTFTPAAPDFQNQINFTIALSKSKPMKKMLIIGGGIAGLSTGCYALMNGFQAEIIEMHSLPGGVCTSWKRGKYLFDHCLHWVLGSNKSTRLFPVFQELGVADEITFHYDEIFRTIQTPTKTFHAYTNIDRFEKELLSLFPDERKNIGRYLRLVRKFVRFNPPMDTDFGHFRYRDFWEMLPFLPAFVRLKQQSIYDYLQKRFKNAELKEMLFRLFPVTKLPAIMAIIPLSYMHKQEGGYPLGGSLSFVRAIEKKFLSLNGSIRYRCKAKRIVVENGKATGIELEDGTLLKADVIVSACDGRTTLFDLLKGVKIPPKLEKIYQHPSLWPPLISISLGIKHDFSGYAPITDIQLKEPIEICGQKVPWTGFFHFCHDPAFAPQGHSVLKAQFETRYDFWKKLYDNDREAYEQEKNGILERYINLLDEWFPGIRPKIEQSDIATPVTWERYTGNWQGSYQGWLPTVKTFGTVLPKKLPGLLNFYMTGQWVFPGGGAPMCMVQARNLVRKIGSGSRTI